MRQKKQFILFILTIILAGSTFAGIPRPLENTGWYWEVYDNFDGEVNIFVDTDPLFINNGLKTSSVDTPIYIEIVKNFTSQTFDEMGRGQKCFIKFTLVDPEATDYSPTIIISDETITNNTQTDWTDFHMAVTWPATDDDAYDYSYVTFDPRNIFTPNTGNNPFEISEFVDPVPHSYLDMNIYSQANFYGGGVVQVGELLGLGEDDSYITIDTNLQEGQYFILKEYPTIPEPATFGIFTLGGLIMLGRKKIAF